MTKGWRGVEERNLVSTDGQKHPWVFRCPKPNCYYAVSAQSEEEARTQEREHQCPYQGGVTHFGWGVTVTLVEDMWHKADAAYLRITEENLSAEELAKRKGVVRGMCDMIAIFMVPHFKTADEVGRELLKRAAAHQAGEEYETPGLGGRRYEPPPGENKYLQNRSTPAVKESTPPSKSKLSEADTESIKFAFESGMFTKEQISKTYGVSVATVEQLVST